MNKTIEKFKRIAPAIFLTAALSGVAASQNMMPNGSGALSGASNNIADEKPANTSDKKLAEFQEMTQRAATALAFGESDKARAYAETLLKQAETFRDDWNYGNALHVANLVLGHIAFDSSDMKEAKRFLLEAGKTPGSPQLKTFGPNMLLAKNLLKKQEREVVLEYFELCAKFWKGHDGKLELWKAAVQKEEMPNFGGNLVYQMNDLLRAKQDETHQ
jgi:hypothetical protein